METFSSPPPLAPPTSEEARLAWLRLLRSRRVGPATFFRLLTEYGSAAAAIEALPSIASAAGVARYRPCPEGVAKAELTAGTRAGAQMLCFGTPSFPASLDPMADRPPILWAKGNLDLLHRPMVALVGARNASSLGGRTARALAKDLSEAGIAVVSGLARGIDAEAHAAALDGGTIAVVAGGIDTVYPAENKALTEEIAKRGLLLTEQPPGLTPQARHFPRRNRIVAGLAQAVVVVEAAARSGSLITARAAADIGRDVMAIPGHPFDARASGGNILIRDGALLVRSAEDIIDALRPPQTAAASSAPTPPIKARRKAGTNPTSGPCPKKILALLDSAPLPEDQIARDLDISAHDLAQALTALEMQGAVDRQPGGLVARAS